MISVLSEEHPFGYSEGRNGEGRMGKESLIMRKL